MSAAVASPEVKKAGSPRSANEDGYVVLYGRKGAVHHIPEKEYQHQHTVAASLLDESPDYISARVRRDLKAFVAGDSHWGVVPPDDILARVTAFKRNDIPGIFPERFESATGLGEIFPLIDYIVQTGADSLAGKMASTKLNRAAKGESAAYRTLIPAAHVRDVQSYAARVHDEGKPNIHFIRALQAKVLEQKTSEENATRYQASYPVAVQFLATTLSGLIPPKTEYAKPFPENIDDLKAVLRSTRLWQPDYSPEDRIKIAEAYVNMYLNREIPRNKVTFDKMKFIFPEVVKIEGEDVIAAEIRTRYQAAVSSSDLGAIPSLVLIDPQFSELSRDFLARVDVVLEQGLKADPLSLLQPLSNTDTSFYETFRLPARIATELSVVDKIHEFRQRALMKITDTQFLERFPTINHVLGFAFRHDGQSTQSELLRGMMLSRWNEISGRG